MQAGTVYKNGGGLHKYTVAPNFQFQIFMYFELDVTKDNLEIHPPSFFNLCYDRMQYWLNAVSRKLRRFMSSFELYSYLGAECRVRNVEIYVVKKY